jgi:hypothetical protein
VARRFTDQGRDLAIVIGLALLGLLVALFPAPTWFRAAVLLPLVLALPGYALAACLFPPRSIDPADRVVYVVALSLAVTALGSIVTQLVTGLDRVSWTLMLVTVTTVAGAAGLARRGPQRARRPARKRRLPGAESPLAAAISTLMLVAAAAIARQGAESHGSAARFTSLSVIPRQYGGKIVSLAIAVQNREGTDSRYLLRLSHSGFPTRDLSLIVPRRARWRTVVRVRPLPGRGPVDVSLYKDGRLYRQSLIEVRG